MPDIAQRSQMVEHKNVRFYEKYPPQGMQVQLKGASEHSGDVAHRQPDTSLSGLPKRQ